MKHSKASLFLLELIVAIFFFALSAAVCLRLFAKTYSLQEQTTSLNYAVTSAQNLAECFWGCKGELDKIPLASKGAVISSDHSSLSIAQDGYLTTLTLLPESTSSLIVGEIQVTEPEKDRLIYSLPVKYHIPQTGGNHP